MPGRAIAKSTADISHIESSGKPPQEYKPQHNPEEAGIVFNITKIWVIHQIGSSIVKTRKWRMYFARVRPPCMSMPEASVAGHGGMEIVFLFTYTVVHPV